MGSPQYVFDTNIFINLKNFYTRDIFVSVWDFVEGLINENTIISSDEVMAELTPFVDSLSDWAKERSSMFVQSDEEVQLIVGNILSVFPKLVAGLKKTNAADPFVIVLAKLKNCTLVTEEKYGTVDNPKMPLACEHFNVKCIKFLDFLTEMKKQF
ncbi:MAG: DUF4411 family protein [Termitinemataceae bacterium]|nr:MAG: DUF4411 family protein [Termitinemataceae bacterium]